MITSEIIKVFALKLSISENILKKLVNDSLRDVAIQMYPMKKLCFDIENDRYYELNNNNSIGFPIKKIAGRRFILKSKIRLSEILEEYDPIKFKLPSKNYILTDNSFDVVDFNFNYEKDDDVYEDGLYCCACEQAPCMCSDKERTSMTNRF